MNKYFNELKEAIDSLENVDRFLEKMNENIVKGIIFVCGNGGSAAIANHFAADFNKKFSTTNIISLCENQSMITAISNDIGYDQVFAKQLEYRGMNYFDSVLCISSSGRSQNVINAANYARNINAEILTLTGFDPTNDLRYRAYLSHSVHVHSHNYGIVEDIHQSILHAFIEHVDVN